MSGLAVLFHRDGRPVEPHSVTAMLAAAPYRGPDGMRAHLFDDVAMGHARMVVTSGDEDERQPLVSARTGCVLTADVRLDNRAALLSHLAGDLPASASDAEIILRSYETWGVDAVQRLLGDFALALWDPRTRRMVCARDTSGQRTLFYRADARTFAMASEIPQLLD